MNDKRLIIVKNSGFLQQKKKDAELIYSFLDDIPAFTCLIFVEDNIDKK